MCWLASTYVDKNSRKEWFDGQCNSGDKSTASYWHQHCVQVGHLLYNLQTHCAVTGDYMRVIVAAIEFQQQQYNRLIFIK